jgi:MFS family permease
MSRLVKSVLMMFAQARLAQRIGRISGAAKWAVLAALCGVGAIIALLVALWAFLVPRIGPELAALAMAGLLALMSLVFALAARATLHPERPEDVSEESFEELKEFFAKHKGTALLSAVIAGMAMANGKK